MTALVSLGAIVLILGTGAGPLLSQSKWCQRMPRVAELAWLGILAGALTAIVGMVVVVSTGPHGLVHRAAEWLANCWHHHHDGVNGPVPYVLNALLLGGTLAATVMAVVRYGAGPRAGASAPPPSPPPHCGRRTGRRAVLVADLP